jgi:hypothetical protein
MKRLISAEGSRHIQYNKLKFKLNNMNIKNKTPKQDTGERIDLEGWEGALIFVLFSNEKALNNFMQYY